MLIDRTHIRWGIVSAGILAVAGGIYAVYAANVVPHPSGGTVVGLLFGIVASVMMIFAGLLAVRTRFPTLRIGSAKFWLRGHLWLGALSLVMAFFHSGFRLGSILETTLMVTFIVVIASGMHGLALQQLLPRLLTSRVPLETFNQQIPFQCRRLQAQSDVLVAAMCGKIDCDHEEVGDAAYNLADSMGKLRNGKEGEDFQKFIEETYAAGSIRQGSISAVVRVDPAVPIGQKPAAANSLKQATVTITADGGPSEKAGDPAGDKPAGDKPPSKLELARAAANKQQKDGGGTATAEKESQPKPWKQSFERKTAPDPQPETKPSPPPVPEPDPEREPRMATMTMEVISVGCPNCGKQLVLPDRSFLGRFARCPQCTQKFVLALPKKEEPPEEAVQEVPEPEAAASDDSPAKGKKLSPLEQMKAKAAARKKSAGEESEEGEPKKLSPLEQMKAKAAAKQAAAVGGPAEGGKKLSPLEQMKAKAAAKMQGVAESADGGKKLSPLEMMKAKAAAKKGGGDEEGESGGKKQSPLEKMKAAAAKKGGGKPSAAGKAGAKGKPAAKKKPAAEEAIPRTDILKRFYLTSVRPYLAYDHSASDAVRSQVSVQMFAQTRNNLPPQLHDVVNQLQAFCDERRQFTVQKRLHWLLHSWLLVHIPASIALYVLFIIHVIVALRVVPWSAGQ